MDNPQDGTLSIKQQLQQCETGKWQALFLPLSHLASRLATVYLVRKRPRRLSERRRLTLPSQLAAQIFACSNSALAPPRPAAAERAWAQKKPQASCVWERFLSAANGKADGSMGKPFSKEKNEGLPKQHNHAW